MYLGSHLQEMKTLDILAFFALFRSVFSKVIVETSIQDSHECRPSTLATREAMAGDCALVHQGDRSPPQEYQVYHTDQHRQFRG